MERKQPALLGQVLLEIGEHHASEGRFAQATAFYQKALAVLQNANRPAAIANLKWTIGETFRVQEKLGPALEAFRSAWEGYTALGMSTYLAYLHLVIGETLLAMGRDREAEAEILTALPTIEEQKMVPAGFAAVALLRESVRRRKPDPRRSGSSESIFRPRT